MRIAGFQIQGREDEPTRRAIIAAMESYTAGEEIARDRVELPPEDERYAYLDLE